MTRLIDSQPSTDANQGVTSFTYDPHDRTLTVADPATHVTSFVYDGFGDAIQQASPDSGTTVYRYDADGNLTRKTDATPSITNNSYDAIDRLLNTTYVSDASENVFRKYDQIGHGLGIGRLTSVKDAAGTLSRSYDERGNMLAEIRTNGATTFKTGYTYDPASRIATISYPSTAVVAYTRDITGRITRVSSKAPGASTYSPVASAISYNPFGPATGFTFGNGVKGTRSYDLDYRMMSLDDVGLSAIQNLGYDYDAANNLLGITDTVTAADSQTLVYDALNRLLTATSGAGGYGSLAWTYDAVGNRQTQTANGVAMSFTYSREPIGSPSSRLAVSRCPLHIFRLGISAAFYPQ